MQGASSNSYTTYILDQNQYILEIVGQVTSFSTDYNYPNVFLNKQRSYWRNTFSDYRVYHSQDHFPVAYLFILFSCLGA